jgi:hypothetical protein
MTIIALTLLWFSDQKMVSANIRNTGNENIRKVSMEYLEKQNIYSDSVLETRAIDISGIG